MPSYHKRCTHANDDYDYVLSSITRPHTELKILNSNRAGQIHIIRLLTCCVAVLKVFRVIFYSLLIGNFSR